MAIETTGPYISKLNVGGTAYEIKDAYARYEAELALSQISQIAIREIVVSTDAATTPRGVTWKQGSTTITGTWGASADTVKYLVLVPDSSDIETGTYVEYITAQTGTTTYSWESVGTTKIDLSDYITKSMLKAGSVTVPSATHTHVLPNLNTISYTPAGGITITNSASAAEVAEDATSISSTGTFTPAGTISVDAGKTGATVTLSTTATYSKVTGATPTNQKSAVTDIQLSKTAADVSGASYTPAGTITTTGSATAEVSGEYDKATSTTVNRSKTAVESVTFTAEDANVTGASYTPAGTINYTQVVHWHGLSSASTSGSPWSSGPAGVAYVAGQGTFTAGTTPISDIAAPTIATSTKASAITSATMSYTYDSTTETLTFGSGASAISLATTTSNCFTAFTLAQGTVTRGTAPTLGAATIAYMFTAPSEAEFLDTAGDGAFKFVGSAATITPTVKYSKFESAYYSNVTSVGINHTSTEATFSGTVTLPTFGFSGTAATITPSVSYSKFIAASYLYTSEVALTTESAAADVASTITLPSYKFTGSANQAITVTGTYSKVTGVTYSKATGATFNGTAATLTPAFSTAFGTVSTSAAAAGSYGSFAVAGGSVVDAAGT